MSNYIHPIALQKQVQPKLSALRFRRQELQEHVDRALAEGKTCPRAEGDIRLLNVRIRALEMALPNAEVEKVRSALT